MIFVLVESGEFVLMVVVLMKVDEGVSRVPGDF